MSCKKVAKCDCEVDTVTIAKIYQPDSIIGKDAVIENIVPDQNSGNSPLFAVFAWTNQGFFDVARSLIEFDLTNFAPQTKIKSAKLSLFWNSYNNLTEQTGENAFTIYRITQEWNENTVTWNNQPATSDVNKVSVPKSTAVNQNYLDIDVTNLVQDIINNPTIGHGFLIKLDDEVPYKLVVLASSDFAEIAKRPKLIVYY
jgi:hypothetical protein